MSGKDEVVRAVLSGFWNNGIAAYECNSPDLPDIIVADPKWGMIAIFLRSSDDADSLLDSASTQLKAIKALKSELGRVARGAAIQSVSIKVSSENIEKIVKNPQLSLTVNLENKFEPVVPPGEKESELFAEVARLFDSTLYFESAVRSRPEETYSQKLERSGRRFKLDREQAALAQVISDGTHLVTGVAGSGKTLVLISKARKMSKLHPNWRIRMVCYNNVLKPYLQDKLGHNSGVEVSTFYELIKEMGHRFRMVDSTEEIAQRDLRNLGHVFPQFDALLVDEGQDFHKAWLTYLEKLVRKDRGGVTIAGDAGQSIYRASMMESISDLTSTMCLETPYRSTAQIMNFVSYLVPELKIANSDMGPAGEVPSLVYVAEQKDMTDLVGAIAKDIEHLVSQNSDLNLGQVAILCSRKHDIFKLQKAGLHEIVASTTFGGKIQVISKLEPQAFDPNNSRIKLMTMHSAKGLEFDHVFLVGLESVAKDYQQLPSNYLDLSDLREARVNLVAPTRAKETLTVYYSADNVFIRNLYDHPESYARRSYPEDY